MNNPVAAPGTTESPAERPAASRQLLLTPEQAAASLAIGRTTVYELLRNGALESVRIGSSRRVPIAALDEYVQRLRNDGA
jgi:excisionase family DNA binding protein